MPWPFRRRTKAPPAPVPARNPGYFGTDIKPPDRNASLGELELWRETVQRRAIPRTHDDLTQIIREQPATVAGTGMDGTDDDSGAGFKSAFNFGWGGVPEAQAAWYGAQSFIGYQMCAILAQHWLINKACTQPARDAVRKGWEYTTDDAVPNSKAIIARQHKLDKQFKVKQHLVEFERFLRIYGVRIALFKVDSDDPFYYEKPFNPDGVKPGSYRGIVQVDPYWITPELDGVSSSDPSAPDFYEPTYWRVSGQRYHRSHLIVARLNNPPDVLKPTYYYGGIPLTQQIYERVYAAERTANEGPQLALTKRATVVHTNLQAVAADEPAFRKRLGNWAYYRDNYGVKVAGEDETVEQFETSLNDLDTVIMTQYQLVAAIADVPATKLFGVQPKGFNSTGEYEEASYHESLESIQTHDLQPVIERHDLLCMRSDIAPRFSMPPVTLGVAWNELDAETGQQAAERRKTDAEADKLLAETGAIDGVDIREKLIADKNSGYNTLAPIKPEGAAPANVVEPNAPKAAPNTEPGQTPTPAPAGGSSGGGFGSN